MIIGAPKSGTTTIFDLFSTHNEIFTPIIKEPHFFLDEISDQKTISDTGTYQKIFADAAADEKILEASVWYYRTPNALKRALTANPEMKFVLCVRNPVTMVPSLHGQLLHSLLEDEEDLNKAWSLAVHRRKKSQLFPKISLTVYQDAALYGTYLEEILSVVPRDKLKIVVFERLISEPSTVVIELCDFFQVERLEIDNLSNTNPRTALKYKFVKRLMMNQSLPARFLKKLSKSLLGDIFYYKLVKTSVALNSRKTARPTLDDILKENVIAHYKQEVIRFRHLSGLDLKEWGEFNFAKRE